MSKQLHDIYYIQGSEKCIDVVDEYRLTRGHIGNVREDEGLLKLLQAVKEELESWRDDFYYEEKMRTEAVMFLQNAMYHQYLPNNTWNTYYQRVLSLFHEHGELLFKSFMTKRKTYLKKRPCLRITLSDGTLVPYMSYGQLGEDFGRYRTDVIIRHSRLKDKDSGKNIDFEWILKLIL
mgnify:CR=1 FL=1